jgi:Xaa-Pro aminopeptidase
MKYLPLPSDLFIDNRKRFSALLKPGGMAIFNSNDIYPTGADGTMPFRQASDIFHLSGVDQEESVLVIFPDAFLPEHREILFLKETNEHIAIWEGEKLSKKGAFKVSGIQTVYWLDQFEKVFKDLMAQASYVYLNTNEHLRASSPVETREARFVKQVKAQWPAHSFERSAPLMHQVRAVKNEFEVQVMTQAAKITTGGFLEVLKKIKPGVWEFELEAEFMYYFLKNRSRGFAYTPIIASGYNACVLHYIENNTQCLDGDVILFDVGAEYANYACDVSRAFPVNGRFSDRQKTIYNAVLHVQKEAIKLLRPGVYLNDYHKQVGDLMTDALLGLGLLQKQDVQNQNLEWPAYKKYFMHGTSHFLGIDVHDVGLWNKPIEVGQVFTVEPGIYLPDERLGIRIEDDIVITESGHINLTAGIPKEVDEIEAMMNAG